MSDYILPEAMMTNCQMQGAILADVWDNAQCIQSGSTVFNDLQSLLTKVPCCMKDTAKEIFLKNPQFAWSLVGILSASLVIAYATHKYIECACNITDVKKFVEEMLKDVDKFVKEAKDNVDEVFHMLTSSPNSEIRDVFLISKMKEAEYKLEAAEKLLIRGKKRVEDLISKYKSSRNYSLALSGVGLTVMTGLTGVVGFMFPPAGAVVLAGNAIRVGLGTAAAVGTINIAVWIALMVNGLQKISNMEGALLSTWEHCEIRLVEHELVKKRLDDINSMILDLAKEDPRIAGINAVQVFRSCNG